MTSRTSICETVFERNYGLSPIELASGDIVMRISVPDWQDFVTAMIHHPGHTPGIINTEPFILTPELITATDIPLEGIASNRGQIETRARFAQELTTMRPNGFLLLNTVLFDDRHTKPRIGTQRIADGSIKSSTFKITGNMPQEQEVFTQAIPPDGTLTEAIMRARAAEDLPPPFWGIQPLTCADFIDHSDILHPDTTAALISSCWPVDASSSVRPNDSRQQAFIEDLCARAFSEHPNLQDIVMADRLPLNSTAPGPFNLHSYRL